MMRPVILSRPEKLAFLLVTFDAGGSDTTSSPGSRVAGVPATLLGWRCPGGSPGGESESVGGGIRAAKQVRARVRNISRGFNRRIGLATYKHIRRSRALRLTRRIRRGKGGFRPCPAAQKRFRAKWVPVRVKKTRQHNNLAFGSASRTEL